MTTETGASTHISGLRQSYDSGASTYDEERYHSPKGRMFTESETSVLLSWLNLGPSKRVLDIPVGTGRFSPALARTGAAVVGLDISTGMLKKAASKRPADGPARLHFTQGSGLSLPFADNTFDAVISFKFFHLIPNNLKRQFVDEMARVLKPGCPMVLEFNSPFYGAVLAWLRYTFRKKTPGGMRMKCLFPDQVPQLFQGLQVKRMQGIQLPFSLALSAVLGRGAVDSLGSWLGATPGLRYLNYAIIIEVTKPGLG